MKRYKEIREIFRNYKKNIQLLEENLIIYDKIREEERGYINNSKDPISQARKAVIIRDLLYMQLKHEERELIDKVYKHNMSVNEIAEAGFISPSTHFRRMDVIYEKMQKYLDTYSEILDN